MASVPAVELPVRLVIVNGDEFMEQLAGLFERLTTAVERVEANTAHPPLKVKTAGAFEAANFSEGGDLTAVADAVNTTGETEELTTPAAPSAATPDEPAAKPAPSRRRTKVQLDEDRENGLDDEYQRLAKAMPDSSVDEIRTRLYADVANAAGEEPEQDGFASENEAPLFAAEEKPAEPAAPASDDEWVPDWA